jgi:hypothetical protein
MTLVRQGLLVPTNRRPGMLRRGRLLRRTAAGHPERSPGALGGGLEECIKASREPDEESDRTLSSGSGMMPK